MTKGPSEARFREALRDIDLELDFYKPPDDARNWKPSDYIVWSRYDSLTTSFFFEVKQTPALERFPFADIRPSQRDGIRRARRLHIPYLLVVWWPRHKLWTISDAVALFDWYDQLPAGAKPLSVSRGDLLSTFGADATSATLPAMLKQVLLGELVALA